MSWSYSADPSSSDLDAVRFHAQDTDSSDPLLSDEEIDYLISIWRPIYNSVFYVASKAAEAIAAKFAREVSVSGDGVNVAVEQLQEKYTALAANLREAHKSATGGAGGFPLAGGTIFGEYHDSTIKPLSFGLGMHDNPQAGEQGFEGQEALPGFRW